MSWGCVGYFSPSMDQATSNHTNELGKLWVTQNMNSKNIKKLSRRAKHSTVQASSLPVSQQYWMAGLSEPWWNRCRHRGFFGHHEAWWGWAHPKWMLFLCAESLTSRYITYSDTKMWLDHHRSSKFLGDCHLWQTPVLSVQPSCSLVLWQEALHTSSATMCWTLGTDRSIENAWFVGNFRKK